MSTITSTWRGSLLHATHKRICNLEKDNGKAGFKFLDAKLPSHSEWDITHVSTENATANAHAVPGEERSNDAQARKKRIWFGLAKLCFNSDTIAFIAGPWHAGVMVPLIGFYHSCVSMD